MRIRFQDTLSTISLYIAFHISFFALVLNDDHMVQEVRPRTPSLVGILHDSPQTHNTTWFIQNLILISKAFICKCVQLTDSSRVNLGNQNKALQDGYTMVLKMRVCDGVQVGSVEAIVKEGTHVIQAASSPLENKRNFLLAKTLMDSTQFTFSLRFGVLSVV